MTLLFLLSIYSIITMGHSGSESYSCAGPERFIRGGSNLLTFFFSFCILLMSGGRIKIPLLAGLVGPPAKAIEMAFPWRADDGPTLNAGLVAL